MKSRMFQNRAKKATVLVSRQTLEECIKEGEAFAEQLLETNPHDPKLDEIEQAVARLQGVLQLSPADMQADGAANLEDYLDDAVQPGYAQEIKKDVDFITSLRNPQQGAAMAEKKMQAGAGAGADAFVTDRDADGKAKEPVTAEVPRIAKKKKEAEPAAAAAPAPAPAAPAPAASGSPLDYVPTEMILKIVQDLPKQEGFEQNKGMQDALVEMTKILQSRPVMAPKPEEGAAPAAAPAAAAVPVAASKKKAAEGEGQRHDDVPVAPTPNVFEGSSGQKAEDSKTAAHKVACTCNCKACQSCSEPAKKEAVAPEGWEGTVKEMKKDEGIDNPWALSWWMKDKGYTPHKASWLLRKRGGAYLKAKMARDTEWTSNGVKGNVLEGTKVPEAAAAHAKADGAPVEKPATTPMEKLAAASKDAVKIGEQLKKMYLDAKPIVNENSTRPVREFVESIYKAYASCEEAVKVLAKQEEQEKAEEEAAKIVEKNKKSSFLGGLRLAAAE